MVSSDRTDLLHALGLRVRAARTDQGLTLSGLAERSGVSSRYLSSLESGQGNISVARLADVASALGVSLRSLIPDTSAPRPGEAPHLALLGLRGAGKSTIGAAVAERLGIPFVELDELVEEAAGLSLAEIFGLHGEAYYRRLEAEALGRFLERFDRAVLATGGGIVNSASTYARLLEGCTTVWLSAEAEDHWQRVLAQGDQRPMEDNPAAMEELRSLLASRRGLYARAHHRVDTSALGLAGSVDEVLGVAETTP